MKKLNWLIILLVFCSSLFALNADNWEKEPLGGYKIDGKWHIFDYTGNLIFEPVELYQIGGFSEGLFLVIKYIDGQKKWGFMDLNGKIKFSMDVDGAKVFNDGMSMAHICNDAQCQAPLYGFYDKDGKLAVPFKYLDATIFVDGLAWVMNREERGFINKKGEFVIKAENGVMGLPFIDNRAVIHNKEGRFGYMNKKGEIAIKCQYDEALSFSEGLGLVFNVGKFTYIDSNGNNAILTKRPFARGFKNGYAFTAESNEKFEPNWQVINRQGLIMTEEIFPNVRDFTEGLAAVQQTNLKWVFIDPFGNKPIKQEFDYCDEFHNGYAWASNKAENKFGFINPVGEYVISLPKADAYVDFRVNRIVK